MTFMTCAPGNTGSSAAGSVRRVAAGGALLPAVHRGGLPAAASADGAVTVQQCNAALCAAWI